MSQLLKTYDRSRVPLYLQVASALRQRIEARQWLPGQKISTLVELEKEFQVARVTVRQAVGILREEGLLNSRQGRGTFVAETSPSRHWLKLATSWDLMIQSIKDNVPKRIKVDNPPAFPDLRPGEGDPAPRYTFLRSAQYKDGRPYGLVSLHLAKDIFDRAPADFTGRTALPVLAGLGDIAKAGHPDIGDEGAASPEEPVVFLPRQPCADPLPASVHAPSVRGNRARPPRGTMVLILG